MRTSARGTDQRERERARKEGNECVVDLGCKIERKSADRFYYLSSCTYVHEKEWKEIEEILFFGENITSSLETDNIEETEEDDTHTHTHTYIDTSPPTKREEFNR